MSDINHPPTHQTSPPTAPGQGETYWTEQRRRAAHPVQPPDEQTAAAAPRREIDGGAPPATTAWSHGSTAPPGPSGSDSVQAFTTAEVAAPSQYPHRTTGKLFFRSGGQDCVASAAVVNRRGILTAAHCVRSPETSQWSTDVVFAPAYNNGPSPHYGIWPVGTMFVRNEWLGPPVDVSYDFAFCQVPSVHGTTIGDVVGHLGIAVNQATTRYWDDHGYPAQPVPGFPFDGHKMWNCGGDYSHTIGATIRKDGNLTPGASGGPWIMRDDTGGFHANGTYSMWFGGPPPTQNSSPYFRDVVLDLFHTAFD